MFKHSLFLLFLFVFAFSSGCAFLRGGADDSSEEGSYTEDMGEDEETHEDDYEDEEEYEDDYEEEEDDGPGFFGRLFGFGGSDNEDEDEDEDEDLSGSIEEGEGQSFDEEYAGEDPSDIDYGEDSDSMAEGSQDEETPSSEDYNEETAGDMPTSSEEAPQADTAVTAPAQPAQTAKPKNIPLNKIRSAPYKKAGYLVNAVYIARQGDSLETVSQKIYNSQEAVESLRQINSHIGSRALKVGDKIYYNSPLRPDDSAQLLFYWRDINAPGSVYALSPGDNIRTVASQLLGHPKSWKEIWATNPELESKAEVAKTLNIVYWPESANEAPAQEAPTTQDQPQDDPLAPAPLKSAMPEEETAPVLEELPGPSLPEGPDSSLPDIAPVPEPKPKSSFLKQKEILIVLAGIALAIFFIVRLILKKRKQRDFDYTATNIEV